VVGEIHSGFLGLVHALSCLVSFMSVYEYHRKQ